MIYFNNWRVSAGEGLPVTVVSVVVLFGSEISNNTASNSRRRESEL